MVRILMFTALTASTLVSLMSFAFIFRMLSVFSEGGIFAGFVYAITEPVLIPIRSAFNKMGLFEDSPFDFSIIAAIFLFMLLSLFMPTIY